jgi:peptidoglycan L-alanyl-D-glutamate endopeptidase CwlK
MTGFLLSHRSRANLFGVHPDLVRVINRAIEISAVEFIITQGLRTAEQEEEAVASGHSETMHSRHLHGMAVDVAAIVGGAASWDWPHYMKIADAFLQAGAELNVAIVWGGSWKTLKDGCHFELNRAAYPDPVQP